MLLYYLLIILMCIPFVLGVNKTVEIHKSNSNHSSTTESRKHIDSVVNKPKASVPSDESTQNTPSLTLLKDSHATLLSLEKDLDKDKTGEPSASKIYARKGVDQAQIKDDNITDNSKEIMELSHPSTTKTSGENVALGSHTVLDKNGKNDNNYLKTSTVEPKTIKTIHKKPLVLSYSKLAMDQPTPNDDLKLPAAKSSSNTLVPEQMPSPSKDNSSPTTKMHPLNDKKPDIITPIVITILVVPMFAVLGYMVLRRGQEAWKNRHYKRMDFLLDGMYND